jgi:hypothetical protein
MISGYSGDFTTDIMIFVGEVSCRRFFGDVWWIFDDVWWI